MNTIIFTIVKIINILFFFICKIIKIHYILFILIFSFTVVIIIISFFYFPFSKELNNNGIFLNVHFKEIAFYFSIEKFDTNLQKKDDFLYLLKEHFLKMYHLEAKKKTNYLFTLRLEVSSLHFACVEN